MFLHLRHFFWESLERKRGLNVPSFPLRWLLGELPLFVCHFLAFPPPCCRILPVASQSSSDLLAFYPRHAFVSSRVSIWRAGVGRWAAKEFRQFGHKEWSRKLTSCLVCSSLFSMLFASRKSFSWARAFCDVTRDSTSRSIVWICSIQLRTSYNGSWRRGHVDLLTNLPFQCCEVHLFSPEDREILLHASQPSSYLRSL